MKNSTLLVKLLVLNISFLAYGVTLDEVTTKFNGLMIKQSESTKDNLSAMISFYQGQLKELAAMEKQANSLPAASKKQVLDKIKSFKDNLNNGLADIQQKQKDLEAAESETE